MLFCLDHHLSHQSDQTDHSRLQISFQNHISQTAPMPLLDSFSFSLRWTFAVTWQNQTFQTDLAFSFELWSLLRYLTYVQSPVTLTTINFRPFIFTFKEIFYPLAFTQLPFLCQSQATTHLQFFASVDLPIMDISCKCYDKVFNVQLLPHNITFSKYNQVGTFSNVPFLFIVKQFHCLKYHI